MRKIASLLLAMVLVFSLASTVFAADDTGSITTGSITITGTDDVPVTGKTFNAYKILGLTVATGSEGKIVGYAYTVPTELADFYKEYFKISEEDLKNQTLDVLVQEKIGALKGDNQFKFATAALEAAKEAGIEPKASTIINNEAVISELRLGYYVVEDVGGATPLSALVLDTAVPNVEIIIKADKPSSDKVIVEGDEEKNGTSVNVGDTVNFKITADAPDTTGYTADKTYTFVVYDKMSSGLTFDSNSVKVTVGGTEVNESANTWTLNANPGDGNTFTITFASDYIKGLTKDTLIVITYSATLNENALVTDKETNTSWLKYSNNPNSNTTEETTKKTVYVYDFDIVIDKYDAKNKQTKLSGAKFKLYKMAGDAKQYYVLGSDGNVTWTDDVTKATEVTTDENGVASFTGLEEGTYYLTETAAPSGYNKLKDDIEVTITVTYKNDGTIETTSATLVSIDQEKGTEQYQQTVAVENKTGSELPSTGGMGTTLFYALGSLLVLGAVTMLVVRKRVHTIA